MQNPKDAFLPLPVCPRLYKNPTRHDLSSSLCQLFLWFSTLCRPRPTSIRFVFQFQTSISWFTHFKFECPIFLFLSVLILCSSLLNSLISNRLLELVSFIFSSQIWDQRYFTALEEMALVSFAYILLPAHVRINLACSSCLIGFNQLSASCSC